MILTIQGDRIDSSNVPKNHTKVKILPSQVLKHPAQQNERMVDCDVEAQTAHFWLGTPQQIFAKLLPIYDTIVHWRKNLFELHTGNAGKAFISERRSKQIFLPQTHL